MNSPIAPIIFITMFNESFATAFARHRVKLWLKEKGEFLGNLGIRIQLNEKIN